MTPLRAKCIRDLVIRGRSEHTQELTPTKGGVLVRMEQSGFRPEEERNYQGAQIWLAALFRRAATCGRRVGLVRPRDGTARCRLRGNHRTPRERRPLLGITRRHPLYKSKP